MVNKEPSVGEFVRQIINDIESELPQGHELDSALQFELSVVSHSKGKGGLKLGVVTGDYDRGSQTIQRVNFTVGNPKREAHKMERGFTLFQKGMGVFVEMMKQAGENEPKEITGRKP